MITVLDQYEVEYKETYTSGTYDQVVMGKMFETVTINGIKRLIVTGSRGVVYGSINSDQAGQPGTNRIDWTNFLSYRLQPYREKAGNCRAAKHVCYEERIYDTLLPNPISCFKANGANVFALQAVNPYSAPASITPPGAPVYSGVTLYDSAWIMFDNYVPPESALSLDVATGLTVSTTSRAMINPCVDVHWTKSFPFEPRYSSIKRDKKISFDQVEATYLGSFYPDPGSSVVAGFQPTNKTINNVRGPKSIVKRGLCIGTVGPRNALRQNRDEFFQYSPPAGGINRQLKYFHRWVVDVDMTKTRYDSFSGLYFSVTGSAENSDMIKVLFGYGDSNTVFFDEQLTSSSGETGFARRGTNNWPEFRFNSLTVTGSSSPGYESVSGSVWSTSPIIRGWKYGLYNGFPSYTSAYYRQGRYGQFRDLLEQRPYTVTIKENAESLVQSSISLTTKITQFESPVSVKFLDENDNLTDPARTQAQNLSSFATSSLPYFDLQQRNRPDVAPLPNLTLVGFTVDAAGNVRI